MLHKFSAPDFKFVGFGAGKTSSLDAFYQSLTPPSAASDDESNASLTNSGEPYGPFAGWNTFLRYVPSNTFDAYVARAAKSSSASATSDAAVAAISNNASSKAGGGSTTVSTAGSGLVFINTYDASCTAAFEACIVAAEEELENLFSNSVTIKIAFSETNSSSSGFYSTNSWASWVTVSYAKLKAALPASDVLPAGNPDPLGLWSLPEAYARMLGLSSSKPAQDLTVALNTYYSPDYGQDVINAMIHEISEGGLGRVGGTGDQNGVWSTMDLFRYTSAGVLDDSDGRDGKTTYFSSDGGAELSNTANPAKGAPTLSFNNQYVSPGVRTNGGDTADWTQEQVFGSTGTGETLTLDQTELDVMEALGWTLTLKQDVYDAALGNWETPANWSLGSMPITPQDAYIGGVAGAMTVTLDSNVTVNSIATSAGAELLIGGNAASMLDAIDGTVLNSEDVSSVASGNLGEIGVEPGSALQIGGAFDNQGALGIGKGAGGTGSTANLYLYGALSAVTLDGGGEVDLGQLANSDDNENATTGNILNAPGSSGNGLINIDNTITGAGLIELASFDNQAGGSVEASEAGGSWLQISAATFSNEGFMIAEANATLELGENGATETLTNTGDGSTGGAINIEAGARLAIAGDFTITGSGALSLTGAGAAITSDEAGATTLINDSSLNASASGQIGDQGVEVSNDLTFVNQGLTGASGAGVTLTLNTGANTILNSGIIEASDLATIVIDSSVDLGQIYASGTTPPTASDIVANGGVVTFEADVSNGPPAGLGSALQPGAVTAENGGIVNVLAGAISVGVTIQGAALATTSAGSVIYNGGGISGLLTLNGSNVGTVNVNGGAISGLVTFEGGSGGRLNLDKTGLTVTAAGSGGLVTASGDTVTFGSGSGDDSIAGTNNTISLGSTGNAWDAINGSGNTVALAGADASITGGANAITATGALTASLYATANNWDSFTGVGQTIDLNAVQTSISGGGNTMWSAGATSTSLYATAGNWDAFNGSGASVILNSAEAAIVGGGDTLYLNGASSVSLASTAGVWDGVYGSGQTIVFTSAQAGVDGGGNTLYLNGVSTTSLAATAGEWDALYGSGQTAILNSAQAAVVGGGDTLYLNGASSVSLASTNGAWDAVYGANQTVILTSAQAGVIGGGDTLYLNGASSVSLASTNGAWDVVNAVGETEILNSASATIIGDGNRIYLGGDDAVTLSGATETLVIGAALGEQGVSGFGPTDTMQFSKSDFSSFTALQNQMTQSGSTTIIRLNATNYVDLYGVTATNLTSSQFSFV